MSSSGQDLIQVRNAEPADTGLIHSYIQELATYEKLRHHCVATPEALRETLFGEEPFARCLLASVNGEPAGFAVYFFTYSTFLGQPSLYLEDIFVRPQFRGRGAGRALFRHLLKIAHEKQCGRFEWAVLDWNEPAIRFYEKMGAVPQNSWIKYRLEKNQISELAQSEGFP